MSSDSPSRKPEMPRTLADVIQAIAAAEQLPRKARDEMCSALRFFCRALGRPAAQVIAAPDEIRARLHGLSAKVLGVSDGRMRNAKSLINKALHFDGALTVRTRSREPVAPDWAELIGGVPDRYARFALSRLGRWCSARGISPGDLNDTVMAEFAAELADKSLVDRPKQVVRDACRAWNGFVATKGEPPRNALTVPNSKIMIALPWSTYPASFEVDASAYLDHCAGNDLLSEAALRPVSPATLRNRRSGIQQLSAALVASGRDPSTIVGLRDLVEGDAPAAALNYLWERKGRKASGQLHNQALLLINIGKRWAPVSPEQLKLLQRLRRRVQPDQTGLTDKNRERLRQFINERNIGLLIRLPQLLLDDVLRRGGHGVDDALQVQDAVEIALELVAPLREKNLASLNLERHFRLAERGSSNPVTLVLPAEEIKNKTPLEFELPGSVARLFNVYVEQFRPLLCAGRSPWLLPGRKDGHKSPNTLSGRLPKVIHKWTGLRMNVHLFRHFAAYLFLKAHPGDYESVRILLGHRSIMTVIKFYTGLEHAEVFRRYDAVLDRYRSPQPGGQDGQK
jgi:hypothetical protein